MMKKNRTLIVHYLATLIFIPHLLSGCLPATAPPYSSLLGQDYLKMTDAQLIAYEQQLSDELVRVSRSTSRDVSVGVGFGSWSGKTGYGLHADRWLGDGDNDAARALVSRRDAVRIEMKRRHLLPH
jgi:hypothetical protein